MLSLLSGLVTATVAAVPNAAAATGTSKYSGFDTSLAKAAVTRLIGTDRAAQVDLRGMDVGTGQDRYRVEAAGGRVRISGTTPGTILAGFGQYLHAVAHADISLNGEQLNLPAKLPLPSAAIAKSANVRHRFALNDTNEGYAGAYLDWKQWQRRIDLLALDGINEVLVYEGQEAVYQKTFQKFGYSDEEMRGWIPQPGHQPWWLLQNLCCDGGPISSGLIDKRVDLGRKMADYLRSLGMTPVLPGYFGTVPTKFGEKNPGAHLVPQGRWLNFDRPDWLDPTTELYRKVAETFYSEQSRLFGNSAMYKMDMLHEGGIPGDINVTEATRAVQSALDRAHPGATWAVLGWGDNPKKEFFDGIDKSRALVLDGNSELTNATDREQDYHGTPYAFGTIWNFGGNTTVGASLPAWNSKFHTWLKKPGTMLRGIALMPEAIDNNPVAVRSFTDMAWQPEEVNLDDWMADYATYRYGATDPHAIEAWRILGRTVYSLPQRNDGYGTLMTKQPSLTTGGVPIRYDTKEIVRAFGELLKVAPELRNNDAYRYDIVDVARHVLSNQCAVLLTQIRTAYTNHDLTAFDHRTAEWMSNVAQLDRLVGADGTQLFGVWQEQAAAMASTPEEKKAAEYDIRTLVTIWSEKGPVQDYAAREWNGLVGDYYGPRWQKYFDSLRTSLTTGKPAEPIDWHAVASEWVHKDNRYRSTPTDDAYQQAQNVAAYAAGHLSLASDAKAANPGATLRFTSTFTNDNTLSATGPVSFKLTAPDGYQVKAVDTNDVPVPAGRTATMAWDVTVPSGATPTDMARLTATATWSSGGRETSATDATSVLVSGDVTEPYRTAGTAPVSFAQNGEVFALAGGGSDLGGTKDEYGTIYRTKSLTSGQAVSTQVLEQENSGPWARAGLVVRSDLSRPGSPGYANLAVTPEHGCVFMWDSDGDGTQDHEAVTGGFTAGAHLRISRDGDTFTGWCSQNGTDWAKVGSARLPGATEAQDTGLLYSAVNAETHRLGAARFQGLALAPFTARDTSGDKVLSVGKPATALSAEAGSPPSAAVDGDRSDSAFWGGAMNNGSTWWQVDLGATRDLSSVNVRNYVDGTRAYTYTLAGSTDGVHWFSLGGKNTATPATDAGDTFPVGAAARYVRVVGLSNTANSSFHLTEVSVSGAGG